KDSRLPGEPVQERRLSWRHGQGPLSEQRRSRGPRHGHDARPSRCARSGIQPMRAIDRLNINTIRTRLWLGFGVLVALLVLAGVFARGSFNGLTGTITESLVEVQSEAKLASALSANVAKTIDAGSRYLEMRDTAAQTAFRKYGWVAHDIQRAMIGQPGQTPLERAILVSVDHKLTPCEVQ